MEEFEFDDREQAIATSEELVKRLAEYRSDLHVDRDKAVDFYYEDLKREGPATSLSCMPPILTTFEF
jgi:hypothetical protein